MEAPDLEQRAGPLPAARPEPAEPPHWRAPSAFADAPSFAAGGG